MVCCGRWKLLSYGDYKNSPLLLAGPQLSIFDANSGKFLSRDEHRGLKIPQQKLD